MRRGGKREGAGRTAKLDLLDRLAMGAACDKRFNEIWEAARTNAHESRPAAEYLRLLREKLNSVPVEERRAFVDSPDGRELFGKIETAIRAMRRTPSFVAATNRVFPWWAPRPKGVTDDICKEIASAFAARWNRRDLTPRYARRCWDEYRAFEKDTRPGGL